MLKQSKIKNAFIYEIVMEMPPFKDIKEICELFDLKENQFFDSIEKELKKLDFHQIFLLYLLIKHKDLRQTIQYIK